VKSHENDGRGDVKCGALVKTRQAQFAGLDAKTGQSVNRPPANRSLGRKTANVLQMNMLRINPHRPGKPCQSLSKFHGTMLLCRRRPLDGRKTAIKKGGSAKQTQMED
jgi:hypothetical protein